MKDDYLEVINVPEKSTVNVGLEPSSVTLLTSLLGEPRIDYTGECQDISGPFKDRIITSSVGPFRCTGLDVAINSLAGILENVRNEVPVLYSLLGSDGMLCARKIKITQPSGELKLGNEPSNHSWGIAIDIKISGVTDPQSDDKCLRGLLILSKYFNAGGWFWGASFNHEDSMHFEVAKSTLLSWKQDGLI